MKKYIYCSKNVKSGNFNQPQYYDFPEENAAEQFEISFKEARKEAVEAMKELDVYYLGYFDTKTGLFSSVDPVFLVSGAAVLGSADGKEE